MPRVHRKSMILARVSKERLLALGLVLVGVGGERLLNAWMREPASSAAPFVIGVACAVVGIGMLAAAGVAVLRRR